MKHGVRQRVKRGLAATLAALLVWNSGLTSLADVSVEEIRNSNSVKKATNSNSDYNADLGLGETGGGY